MDNASKALIMAGAILIAVALVGVGVYLYQSAAGTVQSGVEGLEAASIETKNAQLQQFEGRVKGSEIKNLIRRVNSYNAADIFPQDITISVSGLSLSGSTASANYAISNVRNSSTYAVSFQYGATGATNGYITQVRITP